MHHSLILMMSMLMLTMACSKDDEAAAPSTTNADLVAVNKAQAATAATATNPNGLSNGAGLTVSSFVPDEVRTSALFSAETDCATSGWPSTGSNADAGYAMKFLLCSVLKRPDGPDTVRGGFDRLTGFLCAVGPIAYDGTAREVAVTISTNCFSQTFTTAACTYLQGAASDGPCTGTMTVAGYTGVSSVAPSEFDKYMTITFPNVLDYTIAFKSTATTIAGALMYGLPTTADASVNEAFAFFIDTTTGNLRYEGRFGGSNKRHMRINLLGTISTALEVTDVQTLSFVQGENFGTNSGLTISVHGTPAAGRRIRVQTSSNMDSGTPSWSGASSPDDDDCVGEVGAACTGNTGIIGSTERKFYFGNNSSYTSAKTWFTTHSYLGGLSNTVDTDDIWD